MADDAHAVRGEEHLILARRALEQGRVGVLEESSLDRPGPQVLASSLLHALDLPEEIDELVVRFPGVGHAGEVADVAPVVAAGIERQRLAFLPDLVVGRAVERGPDVRQRVLELHAARRLLFTQRIEENFTLLRCNYYARI